MSWQPSLHGTKLVASRVSFCLLKKPPYWTFIIVRMIELLIPLPIKLLDFIDSQIVGAEGKSKCLERLLWILKC